MKTYRIQCTGEYRRHVVNITAPSELAAIDRAYDLRGVVSAMSLGETVQPPAIVAPSLEETQAQPLASVLAALDRARAHMGIGVMTRRQAA